MQMQRGLAMRKLSVGPSVRSSVKRVDCDKSTKACPHSYTMKDHSPILVFSERELVRPSVVCLCLSSVTFVRPISQLKFSAMFLCLLVHWPSIDIQV